MDSGFMGHDWTDIGACVPVQIFRRDVKSLLCSLVFFVMHLTFGKLLPRMLRQWPQGMKWFFSKSVKNVRSSSFSFLETSDWKPNYAYTALKLYLLLNLQGIIHNCFTLFIIQFENTDLLFYCAK